MIDVSSRRFIGLDLAQIQKVIFATHNGMWLSLTSAINSGCMALAIAKKLRSGFGYLNRSSDTIWLRMGGSIFYLARRIKAIPTCS